ncbi:FadR family transcriptional regulator [Pseudomonas gingeri]|uniref:FadR/GntR family transcriptional regulator n=1 Tax=Pseudomonas gingeri TaxID=117681 RepID=UPI0015A2846B|nr:FCD domain-containing protein [Pseudomonas gingeri]NVZ27816.1 FadR family transcriptional regulator [Pseudomonas gingeri]
MDTRVGWTLLEAAGGKHRFVRSLQKRVECLRARDRRVLRDYLEVRFSLEIQAARLAASRRTLADIRGLWFALARRGEYRHDEDLVSFVDRDQAVHEAVAAASHNEELWSVYRWLSRSFHRPYLSIFADDELREPGLTAHAKVIEAITYGDEVAAVRAVQALFVPLLEKITLLSGNGSVRAFDYQDH